MNPFAKNLRGLRKRISMSQAELAARLGVSQSLISYYESGTVQPSAGILAAIAACFGVGIEQLLGSGDAAEVLTYTERRLLFEFRRISVQQREAVLQHVERLADREAFDVAASELVKLFARS